MVQKPRKQNKRTKQLLFGQATRLKTDYIAIVWSTGSVKNSIVLKNWIVILAKRMRVDYAREKKK